MYGCCAEVVLRLRSYRYNSLKYFLFLMYFSLLVYDGSLGNNGLQPIKKLVSEIFEQLFSVR
jgi:hypothetical protein